MSTRLRDFVKAQATFPVMRDPTQLTYAQFSTRTACPTGLLDKEAKWPRPTRRHDSTERIKDHPRNLNKLLTVAERRRR